MLLYGVSVTVSMWWGRPQRGQETSKVEEMDVSAA